MAAAKGPEPVDANTPLAERSCVLYAGTAVVGGAGEGVVFAVGKETEIGRLGRFVAEAKEPPTPLQGAMAELARAALIVAVTACVLVPLLGVLRGQPVREMLLDGLTLAFATIPEELPILVTVLVALGGLRMAQHGVLLRRLRAAEAVGAMTVLLADKTGTLTENRLVIERIDGDRERVLATARPRTGRRPRRTRSIARWWRPPVSPRSASSSPAIRLTRCAGARARCGATPAARGWRSRERRKPYSKRARSPSPSATRCSRASCVSPTMGCG